MRQPLLRLLRRLLQLLPRKMEMHDRLASRAHADAVVVVAVGETNPRRIPNLLLQPRNHRLRRRRARVPPPVLRLVRLGFASLAPKRSTLFVALLNRW